MKSTGKAYLFLILTGGIAGHLFYLKKYKRAILYIFTIGLLGLGLLYDWVTLAKQVDRYNNGKPIIPPPLPKELYM